MKITLWCSGLLKDVNHTAYKVAEPGFEALSIELQGRCVNKTLRWVSEAGSSQKCLSYIWKSSPVPEPSLWSLVGAQGLCIDQIGSWGILEFPIIHPGSRVIPVSFQMGIWDGGRDELTLWGMSLSVTENLRKTPLHSKPQHIFWKCILLL